MKHCEIMQVGTDENKRTDPTDRAMTQTPKTRKIHDLPYCQPTALQEPALSRSVTCVKSLSCTLNNYQFNFSSAASNSSLPFPQSYFLDLITSASSSVDNVTVFCVCDFRMTICRNGLRRVWSCLNRASDVLSTGRMNGLLCVVVWSFGVLCLPPSSSVGSLSLILCFKGVWRHLVNAMLWSPFR